MVFKYSAAPVLVSQVDYQQSNSMASFGNLSGNWLVAMVTVANAGESC